MLDALRRGATTWVAKLLLGLLVVSFAVWGIADVFRPGGGNSVAEVGGTDVTIAEFDARYRREVQALSRQFGQPIDADFAAQLNIPNQVLDRMLGEATLTEAAASLGLGVSDEAVAKAIAADPTFQPNGSFDRAYFNQILAQNELNEAQYVRERRIAMLRQQLAEGLFGGVRAPTALMEQLSRFRDEVRIVEYLELPRTLIEPAPVPTDADLTAFFEERKADYRAPEYRELRYTTLTPESLADPASVSDEDARREYERTQSQYGTAEQRRIQQILFPTVAEAAAAAEKIAGGARFEDVVAERKLSPADVELGLLTRDKILDPAVADAAFALQEGGISAPVEARFGGALLRVTEIVPASIRPFEEVAGEIKQQIARQAAERSVLDTYDEIEDARAGGATLAEVAERFKLPLTAVEAVDADGLNPSGAKVDIPQAEAVLQAAFAAEGGVETDPVALENRGYLFYEVVEVVPPRDRPLEEVRDRVTGAWTEERIDALLQERAEALEEALKGGEDMAAVAQKAATEVRTTDAFARNGDVAALGEAGVDAAFGGPEGHVASIERPDGARVLLRVKSAVVPPFFPEMAGNPDVAKRMSQELQSGLMAQYIQDKQDDFGTSINQAALQRVVGVTSR